MLNSDSQKPVQILMKETTSTIVGLQSLDDIDVLSEALSYEIPGAKYSQQYKMGHWDGREKLLSKKLTLPTGLVSRAQNVLEGLGRRVEIQNLIAYPEIVGEKPISSIRPYPYQNLVIEQALDKKRGTIQIATGGGKSVIIAYVAATIGLPTMVYVISLELLDQLKSMLEAVIGTEVGVVGGGRCSIKTITVCSVWTAGLACGEKLEKADEDEDSAKDLWSPSDLQREEIRAAVENAKVAMLDESQFAAAATIRMILKNSRSAAYRYGFSATPWRSAGDDILLEAAFGEKICSISGTELIEQGYLVAPKIMFRDIPKLAKVQKNWQAVKSKYIIDNVERNQILVKNALRLVEMGRKPLMLFRDLKHGENLRSLLAEHTRAELDSGASSDDARLGLKQKFLDGQIDVIVSSSILDQGFDLPKLDALVLCSGGKSTAKALQRVGRVLRTSPGKTDAIVVDTYDQSHYVGAHAYERYKIYKTEPAFMVKTEAAMAEFIRKQEWSEL